jgi:hypothetical protein
MSLAASIVPGSAHVHLIHGAAETTAITVAALTTAADVCCTRCGYSFTLVHSG